MNGTNNVLSLPKDSSKITTETGTIFLSATHIRNKGTIEIKPQDASYSHIFIDSPSHNLDLNNSGLISVDEGTNFGGRVSIAGTEENSLQEVRLSGGGTISAAKINVSCWDLNIVGNSRFYISTPRNAPTPLSPLTLDVLTLKIPEGNTMSVESSRVGGAVPLTLVGKSVSTIVIDLSFMDRLYKFCVAFNMVRDKVPYKIEQNHSGVI